MKPLYTPWDNHSDTDGHSGSRNQHRFFNISGTSYPTGYTDGHAPTAMLHNRRSVSFFRNFVFGVEDSLVSTVGLLSGIALAAVSRETIFLTGVVLIFVEAFSMSAGSFLSESSAEGYASGVDKPTRSNIVAAVIMFFSYFLAGFIPLFPYLLWSVDTALKASIFFSVVTLFGLGSLSATLSGTRLLKSALRMSIIGGMAIVIGAVAGIAVSRL